MESRTLLTILNDSDLRRFYRLFIIGYNPFMNTNKTIKFLKSLFVVVLLLTSFTSSVSAVVRVKGYYRKDGTYVQPHYRSDPDRTVNNNWSTQGNVNPYTGKPGTKPRQSYEGTYMPTKTTTKRNNSYTYPKAAEPIQKQTNSRSYSNTSNYSSSSYTKSSSNNDSYLLPWILGIIGSILVGKNIFKKG